MLLGERGEEAPWAACPPTRLCYPIPLFTKEEQYLRYTLKGSRCEGQRRKEVTINAHSHWESPEAPPPWKMPAFLGALVGGPLWEGTAFCPEFPPSPRQPSSRPLLHCNLPPFKDKPVAPPPGPTSALINPHPQPPPGSGCLLPTPHCRVQLTASESDSPAKPGGFRRKAPRHALQGFGAWPGCL